MNLASFPKPENRYSRITEMAQNEPYDWAKVAACGSLVAGGLLLLTGHKRAGLVMAASGTVLALMDHEDTLKRWWEALPGYVDRYLAGDLKVDEFISETLPLEQINHAFDLMHEGKVIRSVIKY